MSTTITGNLKTLLGVASVTGVFVRFMLNTSGAGNHSQPRVSGVGSITEPYYQDFVPDASGVISGSMYSTDVNLEPATNPGTHPFWYDVVIYNNGAMGPSTAYTLIDGTTFNLNNATPLTVAPVVTPPTGDSTYARLDCGNQPFTGAVTINGALTSGAITAPSEKLTASVAGGGGNDATGGGLNVQKATSPAAIFNGRLIDQFGNTNAQLIGFNIEQMLNPSTSPVGFDNFGQTTELFTPTSNTTNFSGPQQSVYGSFNHFGSGAINGSGAGYGGAFEAFNGGSATVLLLAGVSADATNGGVAAGVPVQTPSNNGNATNLRGFDGFVRNISSGTVTNAVAFFAESPINSGGGSITNAIGLQVLDQTVGVNNFAIKTGLGPVSLGDATTINSTLRTTGNVGIGGSAPLTAIGVAVNPTALTSTSQTGMFVFPATTSACTAQGTGISVRADVAASTTQTLNVGIDINAPNIAGGGVITTWNGLRIEKAPTAGTAHSIVLAGSTSGIFALDPPAVAGTAAQQFLASSGTIAVTAGSTSQKSESAADTNVLTVTPPATAGTYRIRFVLAASAAAAAVVGWTATWKDSNGNAKAPTNIALFQVGTAGPALTFTTSTTDNFYGEATIDIDNSATAIVIKFTLGSGTITAKASATVERLI